MSLSKNKKVRELYETGEYTAEDGTLWVRGMDGWFDRQPGYFIVWRHHDFVNYIEEKFPDEGNTPAPKTSWEIWAEGYAATGESGQAILMGTVEAETFDKAVQKLADAETGARYYSKSRSYWTYWGCRLFDNEADARKTYG